MTHNIYMHLSTLLHDPKLFLKPSNKLYSIVLFQVKMLLDPIIKQNSIFDKLYINELDNNQIFEEVKFVTDELIDKLLEELSFPSENQVKFQKVKYETKKKYIIKKDTNNSLEHIERDHIENQVVLDDSKNNILPINNNYVLKKNQNLTDKKDVDLNNSPFYNKDFNNTIDLKKTDIFINERETFKKMENFLNSNDIEIDEEYSDETIENTNEIKYADFFLPSITKEKFKHEKLSNIKKISEKDKSTSKKSNNIKENQKDIMFNVQKDLFESDINKTIEKYKPLNKSEYMKTQEILSKEIKKLETENIEKKDWKLMGEVKAIDRSVNSLLEEDIEFERATKSVPMTTKENILNLEKMIKNRIMNSDFDNIQKNYFKENKKHPDKLLEIYDKKDEKSLTEIYQDEYKKKIDPNYIEKEDQKLNEEHNEIKELFEKAIKKLDSLSNLYHKPKPASLTLNVVSNVSTVIMEDAQPLSLHASTMLAPHEIYVTGSEKINTELSKRSGLVIAKNEMTKKEKLKARRQFNYKKRHYKSSLNKLNKLNEINKFLMLSRGSLADRASKNEIDEENIPIINKLTSLSIEQQRKILPIYRHRLLEYALLYLIEKTPVTIVIGETGSGKTTQLPQYLKEVGWADHGNIIACTQPRRVAAASVAMRVAEEVGCPLGDEVGYSIRFEDVTLPGKTKIKYMTDGMLIREILIDPLLSQYSVVMLDEAHERSIYTDILLGILKKIQRKRTELKIIVSSATLNAEEFLSYFNKDDNNTAKIISIEGKMYPVDILYLTKPTSNYIEKSIETIFEINSKEKDGDILVFLTGKEEIETCISKIIERSNQLISSGDRKIVALPLYSGLSNQKQIEIFAPSPQGTRKVIVSTNISETSVTIDGIVYVIDSGFVKLRVFNTHTNFESLIITPISKASALQRAGRAGRTQPGKCYRLYDSTSFHNLKETNIPEIQRSDLTGLILQLKALGIDNIARFEYITNPPSELVIQSLELLFSLNSLDEYGKLTNPLGMRMAEFPVDPKMAKMLLMSSKFNCGEQILTIAAMISVQNVFLPQEDKKSFEAIRRKFSVEEGDHITLMNIFHTFITKGEKSLKWCNEHFLNFKALSRAISIRIQLRRYLERFKIPIKSADPENGTDNIRKCLISGYFSHAAKMQPDGTFRLVKGDAILHAHPNSVIFNRKVDWVIFNEILETGKKIFMCDITTIKKEWLLELAPHYYTIESQNT
ncbi:hypothetical protein PCANB_001175 [Pneumocystis canis]|nr:hypothetical protein PCANB_001175 [Pneumocystis canis]